MTAIMYLEGEEGTIRPEESNAKARKCNLRTSNVVRGKMVCHENKNGAPGQ